MNNDLEAAEVCCNTATMRWEHIKYSEVHVRHGAKILSDQNQTCAYTVLPLSSTPNSKAVEADRRSAVRAP